MTNQVHPVSFKASIQLLNLRHNIPVWNEVSKKFVAKTPEYPGYILKINERNDSLILSRKERNKPLEKISEHSFKSEGGIQALLSNGVNKAVKDLKNLMLKDIKESKNEEEAYKFAAKLDREDLYEKSMRDIEEILNRHLFE